MLEIIKGETLKRKKSETEWSKTMDKYAQIKRFRYDHWLQVYMDAFIYVDNETIEEDDYLPATNFFCKLQEKVRSIISPNTLDLIQLDTPRRLWVSDGNTPLLLVTANPLTKDFASDWALYFR